MDIVIAPDVFVNASVALGSPPEHVVNRVLGRPQRAKTSAWVLKRIEAMLRGLDSFKEDAIGPQMTTIRKLVEVVEEGEYGPDSWKEPLVALAKAANVKCVVTDHPDFEELDTFDGVTFVTTEAWLLEQSMPPPPPV